MLLKILIVGAVSVGVMTAIKNGSVLRDAGLLRTCTAVVVNGQPDPTMQSCSKGRLDGFPDLTGKSCQVVLTQRNREVWRCAAPIVSSQNPNG